MNKVVSFYVSAAMILLALAGCGTDPICPGEIGYVGIYGGAHQISIPSVGIPLPVDDTLYVSDPASGDEQINAYSQLLNTNLTCKINPANCNKVLIDTVRIDSTNILGIVLKNVVATGDGDLNGTQLVTRITVVSGTAYNIPVYGTKALAGTRINGIFNK